MNKGAFTQAIDKLVDLDQINMRELSRNAGVGYDTVRGLARDKSKSLSVENAYKIARSLGFTLDQVFADTPQIPSPLTPAAPSIPHYDIHLSAGRGTTHTEHAEVLGHIPVRKEFISDKLRRDNIDGLIACHVNGESMSPIINDGDLVFIDTKVVGVSAGVYALNYGEESFVKRVEKLDTGYSLVSENRAYGPIIVAGEDLNRLHIIGKVIWSGGVR